MERPDILANPHAERVRRVASLSGRSARHRYRQFLVEGPGAVRELVAFRPELVRDVYLTAESARREPLLANAPVFTHLVTAEVAHKMSPDSQGIVAVADVPDNPSLSLLSDARLAVLLPHIQDPGNLGTLIRVADAAGADVVVVGAGSAEVTSPKVVRATTGSLFHLPVIEGADLSAAVAACHRVGLTTVAAAADGDSLAGAKWLPHPTAWIFGNEAHGLTAAQRQLAQQVASVPLFGKAESLNVAAAAAVCLYASAFAQRALAL